MVPRTTLVNILAFIGAMAVLLAAYAGLSMLLAPPSPRNAVTRIDVLESHLVDPTAVRALPANRGYVGRLEQADASDVRDHGHRRADVLLDWLTTDPQAALRYLASRRYRDLLLPGVARAVARIATAADLLEIVNTAEEPMDCLYALERDLRPAAVNGLAQQMAAVDPSVAVPVAEQVAWMLADINLDRGLAFALAQPEATRGSAVGGLLEALRNKADGAAQGQAIFNSLPADLQASNNVRFALGTLVWGADPAGALQTLEAITDPLMRRNGLLFLSGQASSTAPETAIAAVYASGLPSQGVANHVGFILQNWNAVDPAAVAAFLANTQVIPGSDVARYQQQLAVPTPTPAR
jgi:hypothetical protein